MSAGKFHWYTKGLHKCVTGAIDLDPDTFVGFLLEAAHSPDQDGDEFISDVVADECADSGYARQNLTSVSVSIVSGEVRLDFADPDFGNSVTLGSKYYGIAKYNASDSLAALVAFLDLNTASTGAEAASSAGNFDIQINAAGALKITREAYSAGN